jgi:MFS family permease
MDSGVVGLQQEGMAAGLILIGAVVLGFALASRLASPLDPGRSRASSVGLLGWSGIAMIVAGLLGGWAMLVGKDCAGLFGSQSPHPLDSCVAAAYQHRPLWWALIAIGLATAFGSAWSYRRARERSAPELASGGEITETIADQILGILHEALNDPGLGEAAKANLRRLMLRHHGRPERVFLEHLQWLRARGE